MKRAAAPQTAVASKHRRSHLTAMALAVLTCVAGDTMAADNRLYGGAGIGLGVGNSQLTGDFIRDRRSSMFQVGMDIESRNMLIVGYGSADTSRDEEQSELKLIAGGGWDRFKIGTGFLLTRAAAETSADSPFSYIVTDPSRLTHFDVTTVPIYVRFRPIVTQRATLAVDGYYGLFSRGEMTVPVKVVGIDGYLRTEPQKVSGTRGGAGIFLWQLDDQGKSAIRFEVRVDQAKMDRNSTSFQGDVFGYYSNVTVPEINIRNRTTMLSYIMRY
jgi:hypothetical protein